MVNNVASIRFLSSNKAMAGIDTDMEKIVLGCSSSLSHPKRKQRNYPSNFPAIVSLEKGLNRF
jgi:hypothetical protein